MTEQNPTQDEKVDYIYHRLKKLESREKRQTITKWLFRIVIVGYAYYLIMIALPSMIAGMIPEMPDMQGINVENMRGILGDYFSNE